MRALLPTWSEWKPAFLAPGTDLMAGLIVALVALPLALGFGISSGLGAAAGLATAIVAGALGAAFGGSRFQVSGPTGAMTVVLVPIVHEHDRAGGGGDPDRRALSAQAAVRAGRRRCGEGGRERLRPGLARIGTIPAGLPAPALGFLRVDETAGMPTWRMPANT